MHDGAARQGPGVPSSGGNAAAVTEQQLRQLAEKEPGRADVWFQLGMMAVRDGRHTVVVECLGKAATLDPNQVIIHHHLAASYQALGQREAAVRHYHQVVCLKPDSREAHNNWGIALAQLGQREEAMSAFAQALRIEPDFPEAHNNWGIALVELGQLDAAVEHFRKALAIHPQYAEAHSNLGLAYSKLGKAEDALVSLQEAVRIKPNYLDALHNLGNLHRDQSRFDEALNCYRQVLKLRPDHRDARRQIALALSRQGQLEEAIAAFHQCLLFFPDSAETYNQLGVLLCQRERLDEAAAAFGHALRLKPDFAEAINNLGNTLLRQQKGEEAIRYFHQALELRKDYPQPYCNLGSALLQQGKLDEAAVQYEQALKLQPDYIDARFNLGNVYRSLGRPGDAIECYERVLEIQDDNIGARLNLGVALSEQGRLDEAVEVLQEVIRRHPDHVQAYNSMGVARLHQGLVDDGLAQFEAGLRLKADDPDIHLNRALTWLLQGNFDAGWVEYEWRWKLKKTQPCAFPQPTWDGSALPQGTILLWAEQGLGDTLQFIRYAAQVKERVGKVLLECPGPLRGLLISCPGVDALVGGGAPLPPADVQAPLLSLPRILGTTPSTVPASVPYLFVDGSLQERWREKMGSGKGLKVGIVWRGNPQFSGDRYRSVRLEQFRPLTKVPGVRLFSLQKGKGSEQLAEYAEAFGITDLGSQISGDFRDTAAAVSNLDLVVSVDTSVGHLAGALGVPVWLLLPFNPDWRWMLAREDSLWYPTARLFRQQRWGDWDAVFDRVANGLREQTLRLHVKRIPVKLGLAELIEWSVREELRGDGGGENWIALHNAGLLDIPEVALAAKELRAAEQAIEQVGTEMRTVADTAELNGRAGELVRRFVQAQRERAMVMQRFSEWLAGGTTTVT
jgi:tetratricopeptide (TPR) repeat protein